MLRLLQQLWTWLIRPRRPPPEGLAPLHPRPPEPGFAEARIQLPAEAQILAHLLEASATKVERELSRIPQLTQARLEHERAASLQLVRELGVAVDHQVPREFASWRRPVNRPVNRQFGAQSVKRGAPSRSRPTRPSRTSPGDPAPSASNTSRTSPLVVGEGMAAYALFDRNDPAFGRRN